MAKVIQPTKLTVLNVVHSAYRTEYYFIYTMFLHILALIKICPAFCRQKLKTFKYLGSLLTNQNSIYGK